MINKIGIAALLLLLQAAGSFAAAQYTHTADSMEVPCEGLDTGDRTFVALIGGQSKAGNSASVQYVPEGEIYMYHAGRCYIAQDPILGSTGIGGSPWSRLGELLIESGHYERVIFISAAKGGSSIAEWAPGGPLFSKLAGRYRGAKKVGVETDAILFHQGESDTVAGTTMAEYFERFFVFFRGVRDYVEFEGPIYLAKASKCYGKESRQVLWAQGYAADTLAGVEPGPNIDTMDRDLTWDGCHYSGAGSDHAAQLWADSILY